MSYKQYEMDLIMGASVSFKMFMGVTKNESTGKNWTMTEKRLQKAYKQYIDELLYEYGHDPYNGTFTTCSGLVITDKVFKTSSEAYEWLEENTEKWEKVKAVKVKPKGKEWYWLLGGCCAE